MSTKTTFKRIALVAVAALGLGMMTAVPSSAAAVVQGATASLAADTSSITLVSSAGAAANSTAYSAFEVSLTNSAGIAGPLAANETLTATVISTPQPNRVGSSGYGTGPTVAADIALDWATAYVPATRVVTTASGASLSGGTSATQGAAYNNMDLSANLRGGKTASHPSDAYTDDASTATATYALKVTSTAASATDAGFYTVRIRVVNAAGNTISFQDVKFQVVSSKTTSGAVLTATATGSQLTGGTVLNTSTQNIKATLADANGGRVVEGANAAPTISATLTDAGTTTIVNDALTLTDAGVAVTSSTATTAVTQVISNGTYEATAGSIAGIAGTSTLTVRYGDASATASVVVTSASGSNYGNTTISATGQVATATGNNWNVPLTTKSATATFTLYSALDATATATTRVGSQAVYYTLAYSGCVLGDMSPAAVGTATKATTDANGQVAIAITNANPIAGCTATVTFSGSGVVTAPTSGQLARVINWVAPAATTVVKSPAGNYSAVLASAHKVTWTILDQFSAPIVGSTVTFSHSGANKPASTTSAPSAITDANGQVSYSWTDAKGVVDSATLGSDTVSLANVGLTAAPAGTSVKVTYVTTMPAIASLYATYTATNAAATPATITGLVPATAIGGTTGVATSAADQIDSAKVQTGATTGAWVQLNFQARKAAATTGTAGVPTTVTVTGAQIIGNDGKLGTSVIVYANENVHVLGTKAGTATVTATNGTLTSTATINFVNAATDARVLKLTEAAGLVTASVTDAFGSAVKGVDVDVVGSGGAWLGNGSTSASFKTATDGTVTFSVTGSGTVSASLAATYTKASFLAGAGNTTGTVVTTGAPAGVRSASIASAGNNATADSAQAAADAAAEATDAANAATDAANAAAEAADAATAAAQDAADAVAALSTQVSEMVSALKKQITALTNLVIKIQKKVRA
jgi:hypothetical protein